LYKKENNGDNNHVLQSIIPIIQHLYSIKIGKKGYKKTNKAKEQSMLKRRVESE